MTETEATAVAGGQYLTFILENVQYAVEVTHAQTVVEYAEITRIPRMPDFMLGVVNFRGNVLPVIDLRKRLGLGTADSNTAPMIIVLEIPFEEGRVAVGATADAVNEVIDIDAAAIEEPPTIGTQVDAAFISGIGKRDDAFVIILDSQKLLQHDELASLVSHATQAAD